MTAKSLLIISTLFLVFASCGLTQLEKKLKSQYVPVSNRYPGIEIRGTDALVEVELVYDVTCTIIMRLRP
jgi:hypothetical protein